MKNYGSFANTKNLLRRMRFDKEIKLLKWYGEQGVDALVKATPVNTGKTASSWYYEIIRDSEGRITLSFCNSNIKNHVPIAIIIQYGHATKAGGWVSGIDYINPAIQPIFDEMSEEVWKEVTRS